MSKLLLVLCLFVIFTAVCARNAKARHTSLHKANKINNNQRMHALIESDATAPISFGRHNSVPLPHQFSSWMRMHGKTYSADEMSNRFAVWSENVAFVEAHNNRFAAGLSTFQVEVNKFADMTDDEFARQYLTLRVQDLHGASKTFYANPNAVLPEAVDWRSKGVVVDVKNQGSCGSCWTFSATGSMEGANALATGKLVSLSEEEWVDCLQNSTGCNGGWMEWAFQAAIDMGGAMAESDYPYTGENGQKCAFQKNKVSATFSSYTNISWGDEAALTQAVVNQPGVSVAIDASQKTFRLYSKGVYNEPACMKDANDLDHAVLAVGYGTDATGGDYYLVKNSWGLDFGQEGYIWMARNADNNCGIATRSMYIEV